MANKKQRAKAAKAKAAQKRQAQLATSSPTPQTLADAVRANARARERNNAEYLRCCGSMEPLDERQRALMETTALSRPGYNRNNFAHGGAGSKHRLRERLQKKLSERKQQSGGGVTPSMPDMKPAW